MLIKWNSKKIAKWKATRAKGKARFIWINGVSVYGGLLIALWVSPVLYYSSRLHSSVPIYLYLLAAAVLMLIVGYFFGFGLWYLMEYLYKKQVKQN